MTPSRALHLRGNFAGFTAAGLAAGAPLYALSAPDTRASYPWSATWAIGAAR